VISKKTTVYVAAAGENVKTVSRDQPLKAPRYIEPRPLEPTSVASRQSADVIADVIVHKGRQVESKPPVQTDNAAATAPSQRTVSQQTTPTMSIDHTQGVEQHKDSNIVVLKKLSEHPKQGKKISRLEKSSTKASDDATKSQTWKAIQTTKLLSPLPREPPQKPAKAKPAQETTLTEKTSDSKAEKSTPAPRVDMEVKVIQSKQLSSEPSPTQPQLEQLEPKRAPVHSTPVSSNKIKRDMFQVPVRVKSEPVKSSPVKVQSKPRRQTRATLAYDRVMFFSDFFRRLESDRRLFALPPVRRNRVYVSPRGEDTSAAPVKFPRPPATKKGRIGVVSAARNTGTRPSPFANKRRLPSHAWDHKIDIESIEADATLIVEPSQNQWNRVDQQVVSSVVVQPEAPNQSSDRRILHGEAMSKADNTKVLRGANTAANAESAFICATKHSAKMRRRLKRKQRKRSVTTSEGIDGGVQNPSTSCSDEGTPSHRADERSKHGSKKEPRPSTEHHRPTNSSTVAAVIPPGYSPSQRTQEAADTRLHSHASCPVFKIEARPVKSPICDDISAPRGKTMVEILSHIGKQIPNADETLTSPQSDVTVVQKEDGCPVSVIVDVSNDTGRGTVSGPDSKMQATISHLARKRLEVAAVEETGNSADFSGASKTTSTELGRPGSSASTVTRLSVAKRPEDGLSLKRSLSCGEMRRRTVLTEWEVVTTTNTEVIVTETGPTPQRMGNGTLSENEIFVVTSMVLS